MDKNQVIDGATAFLAPKGYNLMTRTDNVLVFLSEKREINWLVFLVFCCLGLLPAIIYYFVFAPKHQVTVTMSSDTSNVRVTASGNTKEAQNIALELMNVLH